MADSRLGPLKKLVGIWQGDKGKDLAPSSKRDEETNLFRERLVFEETGQVDNHEQTLFGLRYRTTAWRIGHSDPFHEEVGYWMWDGSSQQVMRCFTIPRGIALIAGGKADPDGDSFNLQAEYGSETYGICSGHFLDREFRMERYTLEVKIESDSSFSYDQSTYLRIPGQSELFRHRDTNTLHLE